jgi:hypothetical protein
MQRIQDSSNPAKIQNETQQNVTSLISTNFRKII